MFPDIIMSWRPEHRVTAHQLIVLIFHLAIIIKSLPKGREHIAFICCQSWPQWFLCWHMCSTSVTMVTFIQWYHFYQTQEYETSDTLNKIYPMKNWYYLGINLTKKSKVFMGISTKGLEYIETYPIYLDGEIRYVQILILLN